MALLPLVGQGLLTVETSGSHHIRQGSSARVIIPSQRPQPDNTQHSQETDIYSPGEIRTRNPSKRAAADPRLKRSVDGQYYCLELILRNVSS
jgi:hypothetical protein